MEIGKARTEITWVVDHDGFSYVRRLISRNNGDMVPFWHPNGCTRGFSHEDQKDKEQLEHSELEKLFGLTNALVFEKEEKDREKRWSDYESGMKKIKEKYTDTESDEYNNAVNELYNSLEIVTVTEDK